MTGSILGPPHSMDIDPAGETIEIENGLPLSMSVQVKDKAGNLTVQPRLNVICKVKVILNGYKQCNSIYMLEMWELGHILNE